MSDFLVRLKAQNGTRPAFDAVVKDANAAATSIEASGRRASGAMQLVERTSRLAAGQQRNLAFQLNDVAVSLAGGMNPLMVFAQQGSQIATIYGPDEGGVGRALKETGNLALGLVTKFWPIAAAVGAGTAAIAGMQAEINKTSDVQVSFGDVAAATWQEFSANIYELVEPAISAVSGWIGDAWSVAWPILKDFGNGIAATFVGAFEASKQIWSAFPTVMGDITISTANNVISGLEGMINGGIQLVNDFKSALGFEGDIGGLEMGRFENPYEGAMSGLGDSVSEAFGGAFGVDYLGSAFDAIASRAKDIATARAEIDAVKSSADSAAKSIAEIGAASAGAASDLGKNMKSSSDMLWSFAGEASNLLGQMFEGNKTAAIAQAVLSAGEGIARTMGAYPFPFNLAMAGLHAAAAVQQIASIQSTTKTSTSVGSVPSAGGVAAPSATPGQGMTIVLNGSRASTTTLGQVEELFNGINDYLGAQGKTLSVVYKGA